MQRLKTPKTEISDLTTETESFLFKPLFTKTKVSNLDVTLRVKQDILRFKVPAEDMLIKQTETHETEPVDNSHRVEVV